MAIHPMLQTLRLLPIFLLRKNYPLNARIPTILKARSRVHVL